MTMMTEPHRSDAVTDAFRELRQLVIPRLQARGASPDQAADAFQELCVNLVGNWSTTGERVLDWENHRGWFVKAAFSTWLMQLRSEDRRRRREHRYVSELVQQAPEQISLLDLPSADRLTDLQREYLGLIQQGEISVQDIASTHGVSVRSVQKVLERARDVLREST